MTRPMFLAILVAALGYFVDVYDLLIFSIVRIASLKSLGLAGEALTSAGILLLNLQLAGMLLGGILWGVAGDRRGRLSVLFGSILLYSAANLANAFVQTVPQYAALRFIAGIGLAGEIGAGITLVAELLPKDKRGLGTMVVTAVGMAGGVAAVLTAHLFDWRTTYAVGGVMGLSLFALRLSVRESGLFAALQGKHARQGDLRLLFGSRRRAVRLLLCVLMGVPLWFVLGLIVTFAPEIAKALGIPGEVKSGTAVLWFYAALIGGDLFSGMLSQWLRARKVPLVLLIVATAIATAGLLLVARSTGGYLAWCAAAGFFGGYWALFVTVAAESFGTNLRATAASAVPNLVRGAAIPVTAAFGALKGPLGVVPSLWLIGGIVFALALFAAWRLRETFGTDLDYIET
jgi:MFS transporter, putative metabolite:H+ symporter